METKVLIWGATGQAIVLEELLTSIGIHIEAFFENDISISSPFDTIPIYYGVIGFKFWLKNKSNLSKYKYLVAIGGANGLHRQEIGKLFESHNIGPYTAIHETAFIAYNAKIGDGSQILANTSICAKAVIGRYCIINTSASIDHECFLGDGVHIGPGAKLAGCVIIENNVFVGTNATILPRVKIGKNTIVGAGAVVIKDIPPYSVVVGNPARIIKITESISDSEDAY